MKPRVPKTRNFGNWTEARYWTFIRTTLRRAFRYWKPAQAALIAVRIPYNVGRIKWAYLCADCGKAFRREGVEIDHVEPCGQLRSLEDVAGFILRMTPEDPAAYRIRCLKCHQIKTEAEKEARRIQS